MYSNFTDPSWFVNVTPSSAPVMSEPSHRPAFKVLIGMIATSAILGNGLLCAVLLSNKAMLKKPYNILIFSLAVADFLTGISLTITPNYILDNNSLAVPSGIAGEVFCRAIYSQYVVFTLGIVSEFTVTFLAYERWFAITKPARYKSRFMNRRWYTPAVVTFVWIASFSANAPQLYEVRLKQESQSTWGCEWVQTKTGEASRTAIAVVEFLFKFFIPIGVTWATFIHLWIKARNAPPTYMTMQSRGGKNLLRMCAITAFVLGLCWFPNQFYYFLFKFNLTLPNTLEHHLTVVICMFNSCVNPWIYCLSNKHYKKKFYAILCPCRTNTVAPEEPETQEGTSAMSRGTRVEDA